MSLTDRIRTASSLDEINEMKTRDQIARRLSVSDRAFVRAQMYLASPILRRREVKHACVKRLLLGAAVFGTFTYIIIRFLAQ